MKEAIWDFYNLKPELKTQAVNKIRESLIHDAWFDDLINYFIGSNSCYGVEIEKNLFYFDLKTNVISSSGIIDLAIIANYLSLNKNEQRVISLFQKRAVYGRELTIQFDNSNSYELEFNNVFKYDNESITKQSNVLEVLNELATRAKNTLIGAFKDLLLRLHSAFYIINSDGYVLDYIEKNQFIYVVKNDKIIDIYKPNF